MQCTGMCHQQHSDVGAVLVAAQSIAACAQLKTAASLVVAAPKQGCFHAIASVLHQYLAGRNTIWQGLRAKRLHYQVDGSQGKWLPYQYS